MKRIGPDHVISAMDCQQRMALWVEPETAVEYETRDWFSDQRDYARELAGAAEGIDINPATGPLGIRGAMPGDILRVDILSVELMDRGLMFMFPGSGVLGSEVAEIQTRVIPMSEGYAHFGEHIRIPLKPSVGVIGTSPETRVPCYLPGRHGGNMDIQHLCAGTTIYLPVFCPGAGLSLGDLHGVIGDGEVSEWGLETSGKVCLRTKIIKKQKLEWPILETATDCYLIVSCGSLDEAVHEAVRYGTELVRSSTGLALPDALSLVSLTGHVEICQVVNPVKTVRIRFGKSVEGLELLSAVTG